jgi:ribosomal protein S25
MFSALNKRLLEKKSIDIISQELCPGISKGRDKVIRIIKMSKGCQYLLDNHEWLGYNIKNIRNPTGKTSYKVKPKKSEMLFKPSLSIRKPSDEEYKKWLDSFMEINNILSRLNDEIKDTTEDRYTWKVNELKRRTIKLYSLINAKITDFDSNEVGCKFPEEKQKRNKVEIHRKIFEKAKDQINLVGKINVSKIAEDLKISISTTRNHLKKLNDELEILIKNGKMKDVN